MGKNGQADGLPGILVIAPEMHNAQELSIMLNRHGFECSCSDYKTDLMQAVAIFEIDVVVVDMNGSLAFGLVESVMQKVKQIKANQKLPIIAIISEDMLDRVITFDALDDFLIEPWGISELNSRIRRIIERRNGQSQANGNNEIITVGDLQIDTASCKVSLCSEKLDLTFREYELLKFLARNKGRVFTREALLTEVWRYDYYGGDRTVDVHIRRLRSKIEDSEHTFIETIRQIGYRFRSDN